MVLPHQLLFSFRNESAPHDSDQNGSKYKDNFSSLLRSFDSIYLVLELLDTDLSAIIKSKDSIPLSEAHIQVS
jgi:hypothetical protein